MVKVRIEATPPVTDLERIDAAVAETGASGAVAVPGLGMDLRDDRAEVLRQVTD